MTELPKNDIAIADDTIIIDIQTTSTSLNGFGDVIKLITSFFGLDTCTKCEERRVRFNSKFAFIRSGKFINDEDVKYLQSIGNVIAKDDQVRIMSIYNYVYSDKLEVCYCAGLFKSIIDKLNIQIDRQMKRRNILV